MIIQFWPRSSRADAGWTHGLYFSIRNDYIEISLCESFLLYFFLLRTFWIVSFNVSGKEYFDEKDMKSYVLKHVNYVDSFEMKIFRYAFVRKCSLISRIIAT